MLKKFMLLVAVFMAMNGEIQSATCPDHRQWVLGWSGCQGHRTCYEYILADEDIHQWSEMITVEFYQGLQKKMALNAFEESFQKDLFKTTLDAQWQTLDVQSNERTWQWSIKSGKGQIAQTEIARIVKADKGIYVFRYTIKQRPLSLEQQALGLAIVQYFHKKNVEG